MKTSMETQALHTIVDIARENITKAELLALLEKQLSGYKDGCTFEGVNLFGRVRAECNDLNVPQ